MRLFRIAETDDKGNHGRYMGVFRARDREEAKKEAAKYYENDEIVRFGFYVAYEISVEQLIKDRIKFRKEFENKTKVMN
jgi:hypothetical protein